MRSDEESIRIAVKKRFLRGLTSAFQVAVEKFLEEVRGEDRSVEHERRMNSVNDDIITKQRLLHTDISQALYTPASLHWFPEVDAEASPNAAKSQYYCALEYRMGSVQLPKCSIERGN